VLAKAVAARYNTQSRIAALMRRRPIITIGNPPLASRDSLAVWAWLPAIQARMAKRPRRLLQAV
jgi:hypothetical protein